MDYLRSHMVIEFSEYVNFLEISYLLLIIRELVSTSQALGCACLSVHEVNVLESKEEVTVLFNCFISNLPNPTINFQPKKKKKKKSHNELVAQTHKEN